MKAFIAVVLSLLVCSSVLAQDPIRIISWPHWSVESSEVLFEKVIHTSYPMTYLVDGDPKTAWVFSGGGERWDKESAPYSLTIRRLSISDNYDDDPAPAIPVIIDSIKIMNGYNKSKELFLRNNRISQMKIYVDYEKPIKTVSLTDKMGWHTISIPRQPVTYVRLEFTDFYKGKDNDICISEIELWERGKKIDMKMPAVVDATVGGGECACGAEGVVMKRDGKQLTRGAGDCCGFPVWSPNGKLVAAVDATAKDQIICVMESKTGKKVYSKHIPDADPSYGLKWKDNTTLQVPTGYKNDKTVYKYVVLAGY